MTQASKNTRTEIILREPDEGPLLRMRMINTAVTKLVECSMSLRGVVDLGPRHIRTLIAWLQARLDELED